MRHTVNEVVKALATAGSMAEQNRAMEQINEDFVDILNQVAELPDSPIPYTPLRTVTDVQYLVARVAGHLRVLKETGLCKCESKAENE